MSKRKKKLPCVELLNVPSYHQGTFDNLCAYYTAAMMLSTLFPEYERRFGKAAGERTTKYMSDDPLIKYYSGEKKGGEDHRLILGRWLYRGELVTKTTDILNNIMLADGNLSEFFCQIETAP